MIKSISLKNFKSWQNGKIELDKGITAIIGRPQQGKSTVLKGLNCAINHNPSKYNDLYSDFPKGDKIEINVELDDHLISLTKSSKKTKYKIDDNEPYSAVGSNVPESVKNLFNISDIYFHKQQDQPFLIFDSAGKISKTINDITHLNQINNWIKNIKTKTNDLKSEYKIIEKNIESDEKELEKFNGVEDLQYRISKLKIDKENNNDKILRLSNIIKYVDFLSKCKNDKKKIKNKISILKKSLKKINELKNNNKKNVIEFKTLKEFKYVNNNIIKLKSIINDINKFLIDFYKIKNKLENDKKILDIINNMLYNHDNILRLDDDIEETKIMLKDKLKELKICSFCKTKLTDKKINEIIGD